MENRKKECRIGFALVILLTSFVLMVIKLHAHGFMNSLPFVALACVASYLCMVEYDCIKLVQVLEKFQKFVEELQGKLKNASNSLKELKGDYVELKGGFENLTSDYDNLVESLNKVKADYKAKRNELAIANSKNKRLEAKYNTLLKEADAERNRLESENKEKDKMLADALGEKEKYRQKVEKLKEQVQDLQDKFNHVCDQRNNIERKLKKVTEEKESMEKAQYRGKEMLKNSGFQLIKD